MDLIISAATHRTGSTLLQRICNARKKTLIWGEPARVLTYFCKLYNELYSFSVSKHNNREEYFNNDEDPNCWIACMNPAPEYVEKMIVASVRVGFKELYAQYRDSHDIVGFKEVLCGEQELNLIRKCYPEVKILLLVRNPLDIWKSIPEGWYNSITDFVDAWNSNARFYFNLAKTDFNSYLFYYENIVQKKEATLKLISDLAQVSREQIDNVLTHKIGSTREEIAPEDKKTIINNCEPTMKLLNY